MILRNIAAIGLAFCLGQQAHAALTTIDFESLPSGGTPGDVLTGSGGFTEENAVLDKYAALGVTFSNNAYFSSSYGPDGSRGVAGFSTAAGSLAFLGSTAVEIQFSVPVTFVSLDLSGAGGRPVSLTAFDDAGNSLGSSEQTPVFRTYDELSFSSALSPIASIVLDNGTRNTLILFDNLTFGTLETIGEVPVPMAAVLFPVGLAAFGALRRINR